MTAPSPIRAITLDLDDTLWPMRPALVEAERALAVWVGERAPRAAAHLTPQARAELRARLVAEHPRRAHDVSFLRREALRLAMHACGEDPALADGGFEVFLAARQRVSLYPDVLPVLAGWARRYRLIAVSNGNADVVRIGLARYFAASVSAHEVGFAKPDARMFHEACARAGVDPAATLHVGDDLDLDVRAAQAAGLRAVWVRRPDLGSTQDHGDEAPQAFESLCAVDAFLHPEDAAR